MKLKVVRKHFEPTYTIGKLYIDDVYFCDTLEDTVRKLPKICPTKPCQCKEKIYGETAIPVGTYDMILSMSNRFKKVLPLIKNVTHFEGIRIHAGNTDESTHGCLLVGYNTVKGKLTDSAKTMDKLMGILQLQNQSNYEIEYINERVS
jgi:hypothetical protein